MDGKANKWNGFEASLPGLFPFFFCSHAIDSNRLHCCDSIFVERLRADGSTRSVYYAILFIDSAKVTWRSYDSASQSRPRI